MTAEAEKEINPDTRPSPLSRVIGILDFIVKPVSGKFGAVVACTALATMMFLTFFDVAGAQLGKIEFIRSRTDFFRPILGSQEMTELIMVTFVAFAISYCAFHKGHIRVDLLMQYTSRRTNLWFDVFTYAISCIFYIFIAWQAGMASWDNILDGRVTNVLQIPLFPFSIVLAAGAAILALVFFRDFLKSVEEVAS
jgi:TRAP-type C4-dicarboxylate transport system permease small subunit